MIWPILKYTLLILAGFGLALAFGGLTVLFMKRRKGPDDIGY